MISVSEVVTVLSTGFSDVVMIRSEVMAEPLKKVLTCRCALTNQNNA